jgi:hypothetical protein
MRIKFQYWFSQSAQVSIGIMEPKTSLEKYIPHFMFRSNLRLIRVIRGKKMTSRQSLMNEFGAALQFPNCFGENWLALEDCLCELNECKPFAECLIIISDAQLVLSDEGEKSLHALLLTIHNVCTWWSYAITDETELWRYREPVIMRFLFVTNSNHFDLFFENTKKICNTYFSPTIILQKVIVPTVLVQEF